MPRVIYTSPHLDPQMDGLDWTLDRGELISPELTDEQAARYLSIPGFRAVEMPKAEDPPVATDAGDTGEAPKADAQKTEVAASTEASEAPKTDTPAATEAPAEKRTPTQRTRSAQKPATDAGDTGDTQKE